MDLDQSAPGLAAAFARDGVACVRGVLDPAGIAAAVAAIGNVLAVPGRWPRWRAARGSRFVHRGLPPLGGRPADRGAGPPLPRPQIAAALMGTPQVRFYHDHVLVKEGGTRQRTPWHQDQPYYNVDGHGVSAWIPVDPVPKAGCLELVAGAHRGPWLMPRTFLAGEAKWFPDGSLAELPDIEAGRDAFDIRRFELEPGDAIFFDFLTVHGAPGFPFTAAAGCYRCATCRPMRGTRHGRGAPRRRSTASNPSSRPARPWIIPSSRWSGL